MEEGEKEEELSKRGMYAHSKYTTKQTHYFHETIATSANESKPVIILRHNNTDMRRCTHDLCTTAGNWSAEGCDFTLG